jgi:membrane carboxypeptidase/penicillin-binding protein
MKRAHERREYHNVSQFTAPAGIVSTQIDPMSGQLATAGCPKVRTEYFIEGTQPVETCQLHGGGGTQVASWDTAQPAARQATPSGTPERADRVDPATGADPKRPGDDPKKKNLLDKIRGIFK